MLISASLVSLRIVTALAKDMVNLELAKKVIPNLYYASERIILTSMQNAENIIKNSRQKSSSELEPHSSTSTEYLVHNSLEALFAWIQMVLLWHDPLNSILTISGLLSSFLLLTYFAPRFYATIMIALFVYNLTKLWFRHIWPEIRVPPEPERELEARLDVDRWTHLHPHLITLSEFGQIASNLIKASEQHFNQLLLLRREKPIKFCLIICSILSCSAYIGNRISGLTLLFSTSIALVSAPGIYLYLLPKDVKDFIRRKYFNFKEEEMKEVDLRNPDDCEEAKEQEEICSTKNKSQEKEVIDEEKGEDVDDDDDDDDDEQDGFVIL